MSCLDHLFVLRAFFFCLLPVSALAQSEQPEFDGVVATINDWTRAMTNDDVEQRKSLTIDGSTIHQMIEQPDGTFESRLMQRSHDGLQPSRETTLERYWHEKVLVTDQLAMFWADYDFWVDEEFVNCGKKIVDLVKVEGRWKLGSVTYTVRTKQCPASPLGSLHTFYPTLHLRSANAFISAFYTFDADALAPFFFSASDSAPSLQFYQGWAEGGNYKILNRGGCKVAAPARVSCSITVEDDPMLALGVDFKVTDTFTFTFDGPFLTNIETSSNDLPIYYAAFDWVTKELPEVMSGPCQGFFAGGPTPQACARAMAEGYRRFAARKEYSNEP